MTSNNEKLLRSVLNGNFNDVKECLKAKCSLSYTDWAGHTCLHLAAMNGDLEIASLLLKSGANVNQLSKLNKSPLHFAAQNGHLDLVMLFVANGCALNCADILKMTPLHWAVERNHLDLVRFLCAQKKKLDSTLVDMFNRSSMDIAVKNGFGEIIELLKMKESHDETETELEQMERQFKVSSLQKQPEPPKIDDIPGLKEFYKKKYFTKSALFSTSFRYPKPSPSQPCTSKVSKAVVETSSDENEDSDEDDVIVDEKEMAKKKRLSMSPMNKIDDILKWIKSQSNGPDFSKYEFSLTEAGKLTLDYLNKNDPIREEKQLFLKLVKDLEDEEKSNQEKMSISASSSPRSHLDLNDLDDLMFL